MTGMPDDSTAKLFSDMKLYLDQWDSEDEIDIQSRFGVAIQSIGPIPFLTDLFRSFEGSTLSAFLCAVAFLWKDIPFSSWKEVLYRISDSTQAIYQFVWFASQTLSVDILSMIQTDPNVNDKARDFVALHFPSGAPRGGIFEREMLENDGVDPIALWRRLASEGAPMKSDPSELQ